MSESNSKQQGIADQPLAINRPRPDFGGSANFAALSDLLLGAKQNWIWSRLAIQDIRLRYRGSVLGPFWLTISSLTMVVALSAVYAQLFRMDVAIYLPQLALGLIVWQLIHSIVSEGCHTFLASDAIIKQVPMPFSLHAYRVVYRNLIVFAHNAVIIPIGLILFRPPLTWSVLEIVPALALILVNGLWIAILLGMISARFRDAPPIVLNILQLLFFITPIIWPIEALNQHRWIAELNPAFAAIDLIRSPLLGMPAGPLSWPVLVVTTAVGSFATLLFFARFRTRIPYWV